ncbi:hypothetical protein [Telluribacter sp.]|jgi:hypothetical protein|uniref:hypothetical protein n=1 Tax=Telluribacter sp. TaxID=1978767 RepID=UPI002E0F522B|nr:hypothetical protein [Telluribacter sp.]
MRIKHLLFVVLLLILPAGARAQLFQNRNLYDIWITADHKLNAGKFDEALALYSGVPEVPEFQKRIVLTRGLKATFQAAEQLYELGNYAQALEMYSKYRDLQKDIHSSLFEKRIQACLQQLDKIQSKKLRESTRVVAGFEWAFRGQQQLANLDTTAARKSFVKAQQLGGGLNTVLREQYQQGLRETRALSTWGAAFAKAKASNNQQELLETLKNYRSVSGYIIESLEYQIQSLEEGVTPADASTILQKYASECRLNDLLNYAKNNPARVPQSGLFISILSEYRDIEARIAPLRSDLNNRAFVQSAYTNLIGKAAQLPKVGDLAQLCARKSYAAYLLTIARELEKSGDTSGDRNYFQEALRHLTEARRLGLPDLAEELDARQSRLAAKVGCEGSRQDFDKIVVKIRKEIAGCRVRNAKQLWDETLISWAGCGDFKPHALPQYVSLRDSLTTLARADSLFAVLSAQANQSLQSSQCGLARKLYQQISTLDLCNKEEVSVFVNRQLNQVTACEKTLCYNNAKDRASYYVREKDWKKAYDYFQQASQCASQPQQDAIRQLLKDMECKAFPERCHQLNLTVRLEPTLRIAGNKPQYSEDGTTKGTNTGYYTSGGLQLSLLSKNKPVGVVLGAEYFRTQYQSVVEINEATYAASQFDITGFDAYAALKIQKPAKSTDRLRPYLKIGAEGVVPTSYHRQDFLSSGSTNNLDYLKKYSLGAMGAVGIELQRTGFGFFAEVTGTYNFSGIYKSRALTASGTAELSEAYFRTLGIRMGVRLW